VKPYTVITIGYMLLITLLSHVPQEDLPKSDLDSIERRSEKYLDTLASGETPYVVDVMFHEEAAGVGIITKQNTTADVKKGETKRQAAKFGNKFPPSKHK